MAAGLKERGREPAKSMSVSGIGSDKSLSGNADPTDDQVAEAASQIGQIADQATLQVAVSVGQVIVDVFYGGDMELLRSHDPSKQVSLHKLAEHSDVPFGASRLSRFVRIYELHKRLQGVLPAQQLSFSHYDAVLGLPDIEQQQLLKRAAEDGWSRQTVRDEAGKRRELKGKGGRPALRPAIKAFNALYRLLDTRRDALDDLEDADGVPLGDAAALFQRISHVAAELERLKERLRPLVPAPDGRASVSDARRELDDAEFGRDSTLA